MSPHASPAPAPAAAATGPEVLVVVPDRAAADHLRAAAAQARQAGARLLVAVARPRPGFTTDAAVARHVAVYTEDELRRLRQVTHLMLHGSGVEYRIVALSYRDSRSPAKRERSIATAASRLARRCGAVPFVSPAQVTPPAGPQPPTFAPGLPFSWAPGRPGHVVAVLPDSAEAVRVGRAAGELAVASGLPLALVVPVPAPGFTLDPAERARDDTEIEQDTAAVAGRVRPTLDALGLPACVFSAPYPTDVKGPSSHRSMAAEVQEVARQLQAEAVVISTASPALRYMHIPGVLLHQVEPAVKGMTQGRAIAVLGHPA